MDRTTLAHQLERLAADARAAGLEDDWRIALRQELQRPAAGLAPVDDGQPIPMRFGMVGTSPAMQAIFDVL
ncbi:MAG TPA: hypothetical protein P5218_04435, partial [Planctomycetota bacterium]|nr:hypothetical protein [Planctomycetota bacterium]